MLIGDFFCEKANLLLTVGSAFIAQLARVSP
jgi:hypothetical protein